MAEETFLDSRVKSLSLKVKTNRGRKEVTHRKTMLLRMRLFRITKSELGGYTKFEFLPMVLDVDRDTHHEHVYEGAKGGENGVKGTY